MARNRRNNLSSCQATSYPLRLGWWWSPLSSRCPKSLAVACSLFPLFLRTPPGALHLHPVTRTAESPAERNQIPRRRAAIHQKPPPRHLQQMTLPTRRRLRLRRPRSAQKRNLLPTRRAVPQTLPRLDLRLL